MGRIRRFRDGFKRLTPRREWIYEYEQRPYDCYYGGAPFNELHEYLRRKWSRIRKVNHRNKKNRKWVIDNAETY